MASISTCGSELGNVLFNATCKVLQSIAVNEAGQKDGLLNTLFFLVFSLLFYFPDFFFLDAKRGPA